jgi:hypothetical protein
LSRKIRRKAWKKGYVGKYVGEYVGEYVDEMEISNSSKKLVCCEVNDAGTKPNSAAWRPAPHALPAFPH